MVKSKPIIDALPAKLLADFAADLTQDDLPPWYKLAHPNLWWSAISGLQKAIRRGAIEVAVPTALMLYMAQGKRLLRRLAVIAVEDVCFGNFPAVQVAVLYAQSGIPGNGVEVLHRLAGLVQSLAEGVKDRSACELLVAASYDLNPGLAMKLAEKGPAENAKVYINAKADVTARVLAGRGMVGTLKVDGKPICVADPVVAKAAVRKLVGDVGLLETVDACIGLGNELAGFGIALALLWDRVQRVHALAVRKNVLTPATMIGGNLSTAYDMHTTEGKRSLSLFAIANKPLRVALRQRGYEPRDVLGNLLFMAEGSLVDQEFAYTFGDELDKLNQEAQCRKIGVDPADLPALLEMVKSGIPLLNVLREKVVKSFNYAVSKEKQAALL